MNNARRNALREASKKLSEAHATVQSVCDREEDCLGNYPENLQDTERYQNAEDAVDEMNDALEKIDEAMEHIQNAISK